MTFEEWLSEKIGRALQNWRESSKLAPSSCGAGYDDGYKDALQEVFGEMPEAAARAPMTGVVGSPGRQT